MSLIFGVVSRSGKDLPEDWMPRAEVDCAQWPADESQVIAGTGHFLLCRQRRTTPWMRHSSPIVGNGQALLCFDGRLDNRSELASAIGIADPENYSDAQLALSGWERLGTDLPDHLLGDFAIVIWSSEERKLVLIRDHIGVRPLFVVESEDFIAFSSAVPPVLTLPFADAAPNLHWIVDYLEEVKPDYEYTAFAGVRAVPPAHIVEFAPGSTDRRRFWSLPNATAPINLSHTDALRQARKLFEQAVACRLVTGGGRIASELSGGLDSSSIAAVASNQLAQIGERLIGVTQAVAPDFHDRYRMMIDTNFADAVYDDYPQIERLDVINCTDSLIESMRQTLAKHGAPPRNDFNGFANQAPVLLEQRDARVILSGFGGDQLVTAGGAALAESLVAERQWKPLITMLSQKMHRKRTLRAMLSALPLVGRLVPPLPDMERLAPQLVRNRALAAAGYPQRAALHPMPPSNGTLMQRDEVFFRRPVMAYRLQDSQVGAGVHGIEYRYPMLDVRLLEFVHRLPVLFRMTSDDPRRLIRDIMAGRLPEKVRQRRDKFGMAVPGVFVNIVRHAGELGEYLDAMASDPRFGDLAPYDNLTACLRSTVEQGEFPKDTSIKQGNRTYRGHNQGQILRLVMLGIWLRERDIDPTRID